jgi:glyoxylase-like metal-dependent hydrolase (beta-lactamase superfamily II)
MSHMRCELVGEGIWSIDTDYVRPRLDASHLIVDDGRAAFVDTGTNHSVPNLLAALADRGLEAGDVEYILLTHVHLDHAGGAGLLARALPRAKVLVHPRGAGHIIDPAKLIAGTKAVYGEAQYRDLYGDILPIDKQRVVVVDEGHRVQLGRRTLEFMHTPGHALHHVCIIDHAVRGIFTGDTFGLSYREFDTPRGAFIMATTTPTHFDPDQLHHSVDRLLAFEPSAMYLTHYSRVDQVQRLGVELHADIDCCVDIARRCADEPRRIERIRDLLYAHCSARLDAHDSALDVPTRHAILDMDMQLNAAGLDVWLSRAAA